MATHDETTEAMNEKQKIVIQSQELANIMLQNTPNETSAVAMVNAGLAYVGYVLAYMNNGNVAKGSPPFDMAEVARNMTNDIVKSYERTTVSIHTEAVTGSPDVNVH